MKNWLARSSIGHFGLHVESIQWDVRTSIHYLLRLTQLDKGACSECPREFTDTDGALKSFRTETICESQVLCVIDREHKPSKRGNKLQIETGDLARRRAFEKRLTLSV